VAVDVVPSNAEEWSTYEVPDDVLQAFKHELMATSVGLSSQTILRPASYQCFIKCFTGDKFVNGDISTANNVFLNLCHQSVRESDWLTVHILPQVLNIRDYTSVLLTVKGRR